jgi:hypothetical protein
LSQAALAFEGLHRRHRTGHEPPGRSFLPTTSPFSRAEPARKGAGRQSSIRTSPLVPAMRAGQQRCTNKGRTSLHTRSGCAWIRLGFGEIGTCEFWGAWRYAPRWVAVPRAHGYFRPVPITYTISERYAPIRVGSDEAKRDALTKANELCSQQGDSSFQITWAKQRDSISRAILLVPTTKDMVS